MIDRGAWARAVAALAAGAGTPGGRRALATAALGWPALRAAIRVGQALDRPADGPPPVFVVGHPRSGTTLLHRLLAASPDLWAPRARELLAPSATLQRGLGVLARSARARAAGEALGDALFGPLADRHPTGWGAPEEDDWLLLLGAASPTLGLLCGDPGPTRRWWFGDALPPEDRDRALAWYRRCLARLPRPPGARHLAKNPHFAGWLRTLDVAFPGAVFVLVTRHPAEAIASRLALAERGWRGRSARPPPRDPRYAALFEASCALYREAEAGFSALPPERAVRVTHRALSADPGGVARGLAARFGWRLEGPDLAERVAEARRHVAGPVPPLRSFGIPPRALAARLGDLAPLWAALGRAP